ncbi:MAG: dihydroxy-acid dehydratase [Deltaproteobacteria bacterium]|nr:dihydroxy-acid dehydratase [Deltaproteobacteria bacterium]
MKGFNSERFNNLTDLSRAVIKGRLRSLGISDSDFDKPIIAIPNTYNEIALPHRQLKPLVEYVKQGVYEAGGIPLEFNTIGVCDGIAQGTDGMKYVLPSREIIADSIEIMVNSHEIFSGMICLCACDKTVPGMLMATARLDIPTLVFTAGPIAPLYKYGTFDKDHNFNKFDLFNIDEIEAKYTEDYVKQAFLKGKITEEELVNHYANLLNTCGVCTSMATANSMGCIVEVLGLALPYSSLIPLVANEKIIFAKEAGKKVVDIVKKGLKPTQIMTKESIDNAMVFNFATGGSMNAIMHLIAVCQELGIDYSFVDIDRLADNTPFLIDVRPCGKYDIIELYKVGGVPAVLKSISELLHINSMSITGNTLGVNIENVEIPDHDIFHPISKPINKNAIVILKGNIASVGAIAKPIGMKVQKDIIGKAKVFDSEEKFYQYAKKNKIEKHTVVVVRNEGPKGSPGLPEGHRISEILRSIEEKDISLITDARFSGATLGIVVGYIVPESYEDGLLGIIETGDTIEISLKKKELNLLVNDELIQQRLVSRKRKTINLKNNSYLTRYRKLVTGINQGCVLNADWSL